MKEFLGINYFVTTNKLPTIKIFWEWSHYVGNERIRNVMSRTRFEQIVPNLHFADNQKEEKNDKTYKVRSVISNFKDIFLALSHWFHLKIWWTRQYVPIDETHLVVGRGLIHQEVSTKGRQRGELNWAS